jgi:PAS domain S-box-containing protein
VRRLKVLIVEDEKIVAKDIEVRLKTMGCGVTRTASSAEEAIRKALRLRPDVVLMDIVLSGRTDGIAAAEEIGRLDIPVIYLTSFADEETLARAKVTNPYGYIVKPFKEEELRAAVKVAVFRHGEEKRRNKKERLLKSALLCAHSGLIIADDMSIIFMNRAAEQLTGWRREDALKTKVAEVFRISSGRNRAPVNDVIAVLHRKGVPVNLHGEMVLLSKGGTKKKIEAGISSVSDAGEGTAGVVIVFHEVGNRAKEPAASPGTRYAAYRKLAARPMDSNAAAILKALSFIEQNLGERISLDQLAMSSNMSKYHFSRVFRKIEGMSPMSFVNSVKIERAGEILSRSTLSISEVAFSVGFNSVSHFIGQFRKLSGMTPSDYRAVNKEIKRP